MVAIFKTVPSKSIAIVRLNAAGVIVFFVCHVKQNLMLFLCKTQHSYAKRTTKNLCLQLSDRVMCCFNTRLEYVRGIEIELVETNTFWNDG